MKKNIILFLILFSFFQINISYGLSQDIEIKISNSYNKFILKLEKKYSLDKQVNTLIKLDLILSKALLNKKLSNNKIETINIFKKINYEKSLKIQLKYKIISKTKEDLKEKQILELNEKNFTIEYNKNSNKNSLEKYNILKEFSNISYDKNNIFLENGVRYYYNFNTFNYFDNLNAVQLSDFSHNGINTKSNLVFLNQNNIVCFANNFKKIKLISNNIIYGIPNKYQFLIELKDDKEFLFDDSDSILTNIKIDTEKLTKGLSNEEKIKVIYSNILNNYEYTKIINLNDKKIFSGIEMYKNKNGVCEAYVKLFMYMLNFAGISDSNIIRGYVIDAQDFPDIGHAWLKIGDKYYDPTFDDPLGSLKSIKFDDYKYFNLPYDLFYTNRYDYGKLPENLKNQTEEFRKILIQKNLYSLYDKYKNDNYVLYKDIKFKIKNNINYDEVISITNFTKILAEYEVKNFMINLKGNNIRIMKFNYYDINDENIGSLIEQLNYNLNGYYFLKWYADNGSFSYRLGYNIEFQ